MENIHDIVKWKDEAVNSTDSMFLFMWFGVCMKENR
jgi:hypothetical protein